MGMAGVARAPAGKRRRIRPRLYAALTIGFVIVVGFLLYRQAGTIEWSEVGDALRVLPVPALLGAMLLAGLSYLLYSGFDLLGRRYVGHRLGRLRSMAIAAISYAFNLNLGAVLGGAGFRLRLYTRQGLEAADVARLIAFSVATNWLGYLLVAGVVATLGAVPLPADWRIGGQALRILGPIMVLAALGYPLVCALAGGREWSLRGRRFKLPGARLALTQLALAAANWLTMGLILYLLLQWRVPYFSVLSVVLIGAVAAAIAHIPAGLGVLETVFIALLGREVGVGTLLAALLAYRVVYYLGPLMLAVVGYLALEIRKR